MKKLLDETTDELTRELLLAGVEHRPPPANKVQLIVALGAGSALGLFSSKALAWFGTSAGKLTVLGVTLSVAGVVYSVVPVGNQERFAGEAPGVAPVAVPFRSALDGPAPGGPALNDALAPTGPAASAGLSDPARDGESVEPKREPRRNGPLPAVNAPPAVGAHGGKRVDRSRLDAEVRLVDDMHWAARSNDREALGSFLETYRLTFPDGELKKEVAEFAERLERPVKR